MTPEEIEILKARAEAAESAAEIAKKEATDYKKNAEDALAVNKSLQEQLVKSGQETKSALPTLKIGDKTGVFAYATFKHDGKELTAKEVIKSKDDDLIKELVAAQVIIIK